VPSHCSQALAARSSAVLSPQNPLGRMPVQHPNTTSLASGSATGTYSRSRARLRSRASPGWPPPRGMRLAERPPGHRRAARPKFQHLRRFQKSLAPELGDEPWPTTRDRGQNPRRRNGSQWHGSHYGREGAAGARRLETSRRWRSRSGSHLDRWRKNLETVVRSSIPFSYAVTCRGVFRELDIS
jgi:hypothetical protein